MTENTNTHDRLFLKTGGIATIIGGVGGLIVNTLHPRPPQRTDELLTLVASMPHWLLIHYGAALAAVATIAGLALLVPTLKDPKARAIGEAGKYVSVLGAATFLVAIMVDGWAFHTLLLAGSRRRLIRSRWFFGQLAPCIQSMQHSFRFGPAYSLGLAFS